MEVVPTLKRYHRGTEIYRGIDGVTVSIGRFIGDGKAPLPVRRHICLPENGKRHCQHQQVGLGVMGAEDLQGFGYLVLHRLPGKAQPAGYLLDAEVFETAEHEYLFHFFGQPVDGFEHFGGFCLVIIGLGNVMRLRVEMLDQLLKIFALGIVFPVKVDDLVPHGLVQVRAEGKMNVQRNAFFPKGAKQVLQHVLAGFAAVRFAEDIKVQRPAVAVVDGVECRTVAITQ